MDRYTWFGRYHFQTPTIPVSDNAESRRGRFGKSSPPRRLSKDGIFLGDKLKRANNVALRSAGVVTPNYKGILPIFYKASELLIIQR